MIYPKSKTLILLVALLLAVAGCGSSTNGGTDPTGGPGSTQEQTTPPARKVGINVNGQFDVMKLENVDRSGTSWVRGFIDFFQLYPNEDALQTDKHIQKYLALKEHGYNTILNIKWNFSNRDFPGSGSTQMQNYEAYLDKLLDRVWPSTDLIVIGNEPFIESKKSQRGNRLVVFYQQIANHLKNYRSERSRDIPIFVGAFNNLYLDSWRTEAVNDLLKFARTSSWIAGVDLHIHHSAVDQINDFIDYANLRIRDNQKILISEFSLKDYFRTRMDAEIPDAFAAEYQMDPAMKNYEYLDYALKQRVPRRQWVDFLSSSDWFESRKHYLWDAYQRFKGYQKFHIATYALRQSYPLNTDFTANTTPWILNGLFANRTVRPDTATGRDQTNYAWMDDFQRIQQDSNTQN